MIQISSTFLGGFTVMFFFTPKVGVQRFSVSLGTYFQKETLPSNKSPPLRRFRTVKIDFTP